MKRATGKITLDYTTIEDFKDSWPCNGIPELDSITFEFARNGDLVDIEAVADGKPVDSSGFDGPALLALSQEAQDTLGEIKKRYLNHYECPGNLAYRKQHESVVWDDVWSCMCNDKCPECNAEIEPYASEELL